MTDVAELFDAFQIPKACLIDRRIPKRRLIDEAPSSSDRRRIAENVERVQWRAVLKPDTTGIAGFKNEEREVEELSVLELQLRSENQRDRIVELVHRAIPYLLVVLARHKDQLSLSLADKRWSLAESAKSVLDGDVLVAELDTKRHPDHVDQLLAHLPLPRQPQASLYSVYQGWVNATVAFRAASHTGRFSMPDSIEHARRRRNALKRIEMLDADIRSIRRSASKEQQVARRAELNLRLQELRSKRADELRVL